MVGHLGPRPAYEIDRCPEIERHRASPNVDFYQHNNLLEILLQIRHTQVFPDSS